VQPGVRNEKQADSNVRHNSCLMRKLTDQKDAKKFALRLYRDLLAVCKWHLFNEELGRPCCFPHWNLFWLGVLHLSDSAR
jgi:hypothetical protein